MPTPDDKRSSHSYEEPETPAEREVRLSRIGAAARQGRRRTQAATARVFDTRTERWQQAGLESEVSEKESRKAGREALGFFLLLVAVLLVFAFREELFPDARKVIRYATAVLLVILGWGLARSAGKGIAPRLMRRVDPAAAGTIGFVVRLATIVAVIFGSLAIAGVKPETLAVGGAFTAVVVGLAAQQTLGNLIAGATLLSARPFRVADRLAVQGSGIDVEGTVASFGLFYTTLLRGEDRILIPNSVLMNIAVMPQNEPDAVELLARFSSESVTPEALQEQLDEVIDIALIRPPEIALEELDSEGLLTLKITAVPLDPGNAARLASEILEAIRAGGGEGQETDGEGQPTVERPSAPGP